MKQDDTEASHFVARDATDGRLDRLAPVLDRAGLAELLGVSAESIKQMRSRNPLALPTPFLTRPLRWRREVVLRWMEQREREEAARIQRLFDPQRRSRAVVNPTVRGAA